MTGARQNKTQAYLRALNVLGLLALCCVLLFAFYDQFADRDLPCPLCLLQRAGLCAAMYAIMLNVVLGVKPAHYGLLLLAALFGGAVALRQISLHVIPGTPPYGKDLLGFHFYTWAFITFIIMIGLTALLLLIPDQYVSNQDSSPSKLCHYGRRQLLYRLYWSLPPMLYLPFSSVVAGPVPTTQFATVCFTRRLSEN